MILSSIIILGLVIRLYRLDSIPGEMWGDVNEHFELAQRILSGNFFYHYDFGGDGPLISYLIAGVAKVIGLSFYSIKLTTVLLDVISILVIYHLALELFQKKQLAHWASFIWAVSFWSISLSRQGKPYILVPLFVMTAVLFFLKRRTVLSGLFLGLGMYTQASFWGMVLFALINPVLGLVFLLTALPLFSEFIQHFNIYFGQGAYIGEKMGLELNVSEKIANLLTNIFKNSGALFVRGDSVFRHNIPGNPHLDFITAIFFIIGFLFILWVVYKEKKRSLIFYFFLPFLLSQLASILDINNPGNVPNLGRMAGAAPFVVIASAYGIDRVNLIIAQKKSKLSLIFILSVLAVILVINFYNYFFIFPKTLPNNNTPFAKIIASKVDNNSNSSFFGLVGCCWGFAGQPEPKSINYLLKSNKKIQWFNLEKYPTLDCYSLGTLSKGRKIVLFSNPAEIYETKLQGCLKNFKIEIIEQNNYQVVKIISGQL